jgi:hypothetical protein
LRASKRFPGGTLKSSRRLAISSCLIFRRAILAIFTNLFGLLPLEIVSVDSHLNDLIILFMITRLVINVKRDYTRLMMSAPRNDNASPYKNLILQFFFYFPDSKIPSLSLSHSTLSHSRCFLSLFDWPKLNHSHMAESIHCRFHFCQYFWYPKQ